MSWSIKNSGKRWTPAQISKLEELAKGNVPTRIIGLKLGRTPGAVYTKANEIGISLRTEPNSVVVGKKERPGTDDTGPRRK